MKRGENKKDKKEKDKKYKDKIPVWKKTGGGSLIIKKTTKGEQLIKPGQTFSAYAEDIPDAFKDMLMCVDKGSAKAPVKNTTKASPYSLVPAKEEYTYALIAKRDSLNDISDLEELKAQCEAEEEFDSLTIALDTENNASILREKMQALLTMKLLYNIVHTVKGKDIIQNEEPLALDVATEMLNALK